MNETNHLPRSAPRAGTPLQATRIDLCIEDLLATITLEQHYANHEAQPIEVSYTLAIPPDAVLLDVQITIGDRRLRGAVQPKVQAEMRYEQALADGHSAYSIRMVGAGLVNIALGNLLPGETLTLEVQLAQWLIWNGDRVRLTLPTTIAPRYGNCDLQAADQPTVDLLVEHAFTLSGRVRGLLAGAQLASPTHHLSVRASAAGLDFGLERGMLDRDLVIDLKDHAQSRRIAGLVAPDRDGRQAALITFCAALPQQPAQPVIAELVIDCSGSMGGVSIEQTRAAVRAIVGELSASDRVNVLRFGSSAHTLLRRPQPATAPVKHTLLQAAAELDADLGGTELLPALNAGLDDLARVPGAIPGQRVLFIVSDGEVWNLDTQAFLQRCAREQVRVFAVAVGTAAVEATFAPLTRTTGGALERVLPGDAMAERIGRHFARVRSGSLRQMQVRWPTATQWTRGVDTTYPGDGVLLSAGLDASGPEDLAQLSWVEPNGECCRADLQLRSAEAIPGGVGPSTLARMLAHARLQDEPDPLRATALAVDYQLISAHTALTLVLERAADERADALPELRSVAHMLAAGWGGAGHIPVSPAVPAQAPPPPVMCPAPRANCAPAADAAHLNPPAFASRGIPAAPKGGAPARPGMIQRVLSRVADAFGSAQEAPPEGAARDGERAQRAPEVHANDLQILALLIAHLRAHPALCPRLRAGTLTLSELALNLDPPLFNWLDAKAEALGLELDSGRFWQCYAEELARCAAGAELARLLSGAAGA